jgi:hypothetical protein
MPATLTIIGILLVGAAALDVFQTLFHPAGRGALSDWTARTVWKVHRALANRYPGVLTYAGPTAILAIIVSWACFTLVGFSLVYLPHLPTQYVFDPGVNPANHRGFWEAVVASVGALMSLSQGMEPKSEWIALLRGLEAIIGFGLLTASVSWLLSIYPVLEQRRSIAQRAALLHNAELENHVDLIHDCGADTHNWIMGLAADLASLRNQMAQFPISYYFYMGEPQTALAGALPYLYELSERGAHSDLPALRLAATALGGAVEEFLGLLAEVFLRMSGDDKKRVLRVYAKEQMSDMMLLHETRPYQSRKAC